MMAISGLCRRRREEGRRWPVEAKMVNEISSVSFCGATQRGEQAPETRAALGRMRHRNGDPDTRAI